MQLDDEAVEQFQDRIAEACRGGAVVDDGRRLLELRRRGGELFAALAMSVWYLGRMCSVSTASASVTFCTPSSMSIGGPRSGVSDTDGAFFSSRLRMVRTCAGHLVGQVLEMSAPW